MFRRKHFSCSLGTRTQLTGRLIIYNTRSKQKNRISPALLARYTHTPAYCVKGLSPSVKTPWKQNEIARVLYERALLFIYTRTPRASVMYFAKKHYSSASLILNCDFNRTRAGGRDALKTLYYPGRARAFFLRALDARASHAQCREREKERERDLEAMYQFCKNSEFPIIFKTDWFFGAQGGNEILNMRARVTRAVRIYTHLQGVYFYALLLPQPDSFDSLNMPLMLLSELNFTRYCRIRENSQVNVYLGRE